MRHVTRKGLMTVAAATGVLAAAGGTAHATGAGAHGRAGYGRSVRRGCAGVHGVEHGEIR